MSSEMATQIDRGYLPPEIPAAAIRYLQRTDNADLLLILGLVDDPKVVKRATGDCPICGNKLPGHGVCRKRQACREAARERGEVA